jgi:hypothetical protein
MWKRYETCHSLPLIAAVLIRRDQTASAPAQRDDHDHAYTFGPGFGLPDPSPFVMKAEVLLKIAGLSYRVDSNGFSKAPKGKLPYIDDDGERIAHSTFVRWHLEKRHKVEFDRGLSEEHCAVAWAFERTAQDHLYWALLDARWMNDANFDQGPRNFIQAAPAPIRPQIVPRCAARCGNRCARTAWAAMRPQRSPRRRRDRSTPWRPI